MISKTSNPPNPWNQTSEIEWLGEPPPVELEVFEERATSILTRNDSPDLPFRWGLNPYRGCYHACSYCYARPTHQYLGLGAGTDFDRKIVVKVNAAALLRHQFDLDSWRGEPILFSGITDCYQPLEASYRVTRECLEVCADYRNPARIITKSALVRRDIDVLRRLHEHASVAVFVSLPTTDDEVARALEPGAAVAAQRLRTIEKLAAADIPCGVAVAPLIPGLTDAAMPDVLARAASAGASRAFMTLLRLPDATRSVFLERLERDFPNRAAKVRRAQEDVRRAQRDPSAFGVRMRGAGARWDTIRQVFRVTAERHGLHIGEVGPADTGDDDAPTSFRRPTAQRSLFGD